MHEERPVSCHRARSTNGYPFSAVSYESVGPIRPTPPPGGLAHYPPRPAPTLVHLRAQVPPAFRDAGAAGLDDKKGHCRIMGSMEIMYVSHCYYWVLRTPLTES